MDVCVLCLYVVLSCVGRGVCDGLITRREEFYLVSNLCDQETSKEEAKARFGLWSHGGVVASYALFVRCPRNERISATKCRLELRSTFYAMFIKG
jgi:hypothetical protein